MTPPNPPSSPSTASLSGAARCWHSNAYFSLFSSLFFFDPPNRFVQIPRDLFHSFDPVGFAIFAILVALGRCPPGKKKNDLVVAPGMWLEFALRNLQSREAI
jgi:hypothetical protein